jgi:hypothetical protein
MRLKAYRFWLLLSLLLLCGSVCVAQEKERLRADWLAMDVEVVERFLPKLQQSEQPTIAELEQLFGHPKTETDLGFGGRTFAFSKTGGYTYLTVAGFVFQDTIGYYTISVSCSLSWPKIKTVLIETWKRNSELQFREGEYGIHHDREFPAVVADYKKAVSAQLGELAPVNVPPHLKERYDYLMSLGENSVIGAGACGYGGSTPRGKEAIDAIAHTGRIDLLANILRGYNPGGRVYAALALVTMQRKGTQLPPDLQKAVDIVRNLDLEVEACVGCIYFQKTAQKIFDGWRF